MKHQSGIQLFFIGLLAMFLFGACTVQYRSRHNHPSGEHYGDHDHGHDDHNDNEHH